MQRGGVAPGRSPRGRIAAGLALPVAVATALVGAGVLTAAAQAAPPPKNGKVTLCHATPPASAKNGWVQITVSTNAVTHAGHGQHADDIIPAFSYYEKRVAAQYPGKNLGTVFAGSTGAEILANGCRLPAAPTSEPPSSSSEPAPTQTRTSSVASEPASVPAPATTQDEPSTQPAPTRTRTSEAAPVESDAPVSTSDEPVSTQAAGSYSLEATAAARAGGGAGGGAAPAVAGHAGLAAGDTGDSGGSSSTVGMTAAIVGAAVAGLGALGWLAYWRRRRETIDGPGPVG